MNDTKQDLKTVEKFITAYEDNKGDAETQQKILAYRYGYEGGNADTMWRLVRVSNNGFTLNTRQVAYWKYINNCYTKSKQQAVNAVYHPKAEEIWKALPDYDNYEVSNLGNVRNAETQEELKQYFTTDGYKFVSIGGRCLVHRLIASAFIDNPQALDTVNHKNHIRHDNNIDNLEWLSMEDNRLDSVNWNKRLHNEFAVD